MFASLVFALRGLRRSPGFTTIALLTFALGIGVNTSMFSFVNVLLFRAAPFPEGERLVRVLSTTPEDQLGGVTVAEFRAAQEPLRSVERLEAFAWWTDTLGLPGQPSERLSSLLATEGLDETLRVQPQLGRFFTAEEQVPGRNLVAVLSHEFWTRRFGADPSVLGTTLRLNAEPVTIVGVMPERASYPLLWGEVDVWRPLVLPAHLMESRDNRLVHPVGRLRSGATLAQAQAEAAVVAAQWVQDYPQGRRGHGAKVDTLHGSTTDRDGRRWLGLLFGLSGFVLLIACANLANLQLARLARTGRDLAIRSALGASRWRLIWQQSLEGIVLAVMGGALGLLLATWINHLLARSLRIANGSVLEIPLDGRVLGGALVLASAAAVLASFLPALVGSRVDLLSTIKTQSRGATTGRGAHTLRQALIVGEVALALTLLAGAGVMIRGFHSYLQRPHGWDVDRVLMSTVHLPEQTRYGSDESRRNAHQKLLRNLEAIPGIEGAALASTLPVFYSSAIRGVQVEGVALEDEGQLPQADHTMVSPGYFATMGIELLEGRTFAPELTADGPQQIVVNETFARRFWPGRSALGRRVAGSDNGRRVWREIVGVVRDVEWAANLEPQRRRLQVYRPLVQEPWGYLEIAVRGEHPERFAAGVRQAIAAFDPDVAVILTQTYAQAIDRFQHNRVVAQRLLAGFAGLGLLLAMLGLYGVVAHSVAQRTIEFGIRLALGARPADVLRLVLGAGARLGAVGVGAGLLGAWALMHFLGRIMAGVAEVQVATLGAIAGGLFVVALIASWIPARRATRVNPVTALRAE